MSAVLIRALEPSLPSPSFPQLLRDCVKRNSATVWEGVREKTDALRRSGKPAYVTAVAEAVMVALEADRVYYKTAFPMCAAEAVYHSVAYMTYHFTIMLPCSVHMLYVCLSMHVPYMCSSLILPCLQYPLKGSFMGSLVCALCSAHARACKPQ